MSWTGTTTERRAFTRKPARSKAKATCRVGLDLGPNLPATLADLSISGVRLVSGVVLAPGREVTLGLEGPMHQKPVQRLGTVVWASQRDDGGYWVGVRLEKYLEHNDVQLLT